MNALLQALELRIPAFMGSIALLLTSGCVSSNCPKKLEDVRVFHEVEDRSEWLGETDELLAECASYCVGYSDVRSCRFVDFIPAQSAAGGAGGSGGAQTDAAEPGTIEVVCEANSADSCE